MEINSHQIEIKILSMNKLNHELKIDNLQVIRLINDHLLKNLIIILISN